MSSKQNMSSKRKQINYDVKEKKKARTLPCMHLSTTSSHTNNIIPNVMLDALGLNPVIETAWLAGATCHPKTSVLKFAIVKELEQFLIFFHFVPDVQPHGNCSKMFMYNAVRNNESSFCRNLNVSRTWHSIYKNIKATCFSSGYSFHAFKIITSNRPTCQVLLILGNALCETLNGIRQNNNTAHVEKDNLFWLTQSDCVWVEIIGVDKAQQHLLEKLGDMTNIPNVYDQTDNSSIATSIPIHYHQNQIRYWECQAKYQSQCFICRLSKTPWRKNHMSTKVLIHLSCWTLMKKNSCNCFQH